MRARLAVNEEQFRKVTYVALAALTLIVFTGARGAPDRLRARLPDLAALLRARLPAGRAASADRVRQPRAVRVRRRDHGGGRSCSSFTRKPFRRDLAWLAAALPLGVIAQAVLGGFTVREKLAPGFVMSHFLLSMVILIFAFWLAWRATYPQGARPRSDGPAARLVGACACRCSARSRWSPVPPRPPPARIPAAMSVSTSSA